MSLTEIPAAWPLIDDGLIHPTAPHAGHLLLQGSSSGAENEGCFDDLVGDRMTLITTELDIADARIRPRRCELVRLPGRPGSRPGRGTGRETGRDTDRGPAERPAETLTHSVADADGVYARWFASHDARYALQRPDFHLYGTAADLPRA